MSTAPGGVSVPRPRASYTGEQPEAIPSRQKTPKQLLLPAFAWPAWTDRIVATSVEPVEPPQAEKVHPAVATRAIADTRIARQKGGG